MARLRLDRRIFANFGVRVDFGGTVTEGVLVLAEL